MLLKPINNMYIICIKDLISINGTKFHPIISTIKFHTQLKKKTIVPNPSKYIIYISNIYIYIYIYIVTVARY